MQTNPWLVALAFAGGLLLGGMCIGAGAMLFNAGNNNPFERERLQMEMERMRAMEAEQRARAEQARALAEQARETSRIEALKLQDALRLADQAKADAEQAKLDAERALTIAQQERDAALKRLKDLEKKK